MPDPNQRLRKIKDDLSKLSDDELEGRLGGVIQGPALIIKEIVQQLDARLSKDDKVKTLARIIDNIETDAEPPQELVEVARQILETEERRKRKPIDEKTLREICQQLEMKVPEEFFSGFRDAQSRQREIVSIEEAFAAKQLGTDAERREWAKRITEKQVTRSKAKIDADARIADEQTARAKTPVDVDALSEVCKEFVPEFVNEFLRDFHEAKTKQEQTARIEKAFAKAHLGTDAERREWAKRIADEQTIRAKTPVDADALSEVCKEFAPEFVNEFLRTFHEAKTKQEEIARIEKAFAKEQLGTDAERREWAKRIAERQVTRAKTPVDADALSEVCKEFAPQFANEFLRDFHETKTKREQIAHIEDAFTKKQLGNDAERREWAKRISDLSESPPSALTPEDEQKLETLLRTTNLSDPNKVLKQIVERRDAQIEKAKLTRDLSTLAVATEGEIREWSKLITERKASQQPPYPNTLPEKLHDLQNQLRRDLSALCRRWSKALPGNISTFVEQRLAELNDFPASDEPAEIRQPCEEALLEEITAASTQDEHDLVTARHQISITTLKDPLPHLLPPGVNVTCGEPVPFTLSQAQFTIPDSQFVCMARTFETNVTAAIQAWCYDERIPFYFDDSSDLEFVKKYPAVLKLLIWNRKICRTARAIGDILSHERRIAVAQIGICGALAERAAVTPTMLLPDLMKQYKSYLEYELKAYATRLVSERQNLAKELINTFRDECDETERNAAYAFITPDFTVDVDKLYHKGTEIWTIARAQVPKTKCDEHSVITFANLATAFWDHIRDNVARPEIARIAIALQLSADDRDDIQDAIVQQTKEGIANTSPVMRNLLTNVPTVGVESRVSNTKSQATERRSIPKPAVWDNLQCTSWSAQLFGGLIIKALGMPAKAAGALFLLFSPLILVGVDNPIKSAVKGLGAGVQLELGLTFLCLCILAYLLAVFLGTGKVVSLLTKRSEAPPAHHSTRRELSWGDMGASFFKYIVIPGVAVAVTYCVMSRLFFAHMSPGLARTRAESIVNHRKASSKDQNENSGDWSSPAVTLQSGSEFNVTLRRAVAEYAANVWESKHHLGEQHLPEFIKAITADGIISLFLTNSDNPDTTIKAFGDSWNKDPNGMKAILNLTLKPPQEKESEIQAEILAGVFAKDRAVAAQAIEAASPKVFELFRNDDSISALLNENGNAVLKKWAFSRNGPYASTFTEFAGVLLTDRPNVIRDAITKLPSIPMWCSVGMCGGLAIGAVLLCMLYWMARGERHSRFAICLATLAAFLSWASLGLGLSLWCFFHLADVAAANDLACAQQWVQDTASKEPSDKPSATVTFGVWPNFHTDAGSETKKGWPAITAFGLFTESLVFQPVGSKAIRPAGFPVAESPAGTIWAIAGLIGCIVLFFIVALFGHHRDRAQKLREMNLAAKTMVVREVEDAITTAHEEWHRNVEKSLSGWLDKQHRKLEYYLARYLVAADDRRQQRRTIISETRLKVEKAQASCAEDERLVTTLITTCRAVRDVAAAEISARR